MKGIINFIKTRYLFGMIRVHGYYAERLSYHVDKMKVYIHVDNERFLYHANVCSQIIYKIDRLNIKIKTLGNQLKSEMGIA